MEVATTLVRVIWSATGDGQGTTTRFVRLSYDGRVVRMHDGPTGHESFIAEDFLKQHIHPTDYSWMACAGTPGRWARCAVPAVEMKRALRELGVI